MAICFLVTPDALSKPFLFDLEGVFFRKEKKQKKLEKKKGADYI